MLHPPRSLSGRLALVVASVVLATLGPLPAMAGTAASCGGLENDLDLGDERFLPGRLFVGTVVETTAGAALVEVEEVWRGPDLAPVVWVHGLGGRWEGPVLIGSSPNEVRTDGCLRSELASNVDHRSDFDVRAPVEDGDTGTAPFTARVASLRPYAFAGLALLVLTAWVITRNGRRLKT